MVVAEDLGNSLAVLDDETADLNSIAEDFGLANQHDRPVADRFEWSANRQDEIQSAVWSESEGLAGFGEFSESCTDLLVVGWPVGLYDWQLQDHLDAWV